MNRPDALSSSPGLPRDTDGPVFAEPWQAQAFAMVVALHERGLFTWAEWAATLSGELKRSDADPDGQDYYERWLAALEKLMAGKGIAAGEEIGAMADAWQRAAHATPHGEAIVLENDPRRGASASFWDSTADIRERIAKYPTSGGTPDKEFYDGLWEE